MGTVIDLPVSPLRSTVEEGSLRDAPVIASLMDGKTLAGRLVSLDGPQRLLVIHRKGQARTYQIKFPQLRALNFISRYPINRERHPLEEQAAQTFMPRPSQEFRITFMDQRVLSGRTRGSFVDDVGIHLFQLVDDEHISRLFVPAEVVRRYFIGDHRPQEVHHKSVPASERAPAPRPAAEPKDSQSPKRRKSDRRSRQPISASAEQLEKALEASPSSEGLGGAKRIGEMLVEEGIIGANQLAAALRSQAQEPAARLGEILVRMGVVSAEQIYAALAHKFGMPFVLLRDFFIDIECLKLVPADIARKYMLVPLLLHKDRLVVAMDDPTHAEAVTVLRFMTQYRIEPTIATREDVKWAIAKYYGMAAEKPAPILAAADSAAQTPGDQGGMAKAVTSFVNNTILDAIRRGASDIHIVSERDHAELRFRMGGSVIPIRRFHRVLLPGVINRLRVMSRLRESAADGAHGHACMLSGDDVIRLHVTLKRDARGDQAVVRILDSMLRLGRVRDLAMAPGDRQRLTEMLAKTYSLLVVSGPRGSGKSRTLYAALRTLRDMRLGIATVEAPVKFFVDGLHQYQAGSGDEEFRRALENAQSIQPDVLMIGMLNGAQTLKVAMEAALGGCLVLSKIHSNSAATAIADMMQLDAGHRLLTSTLSGVLGQHLVRLNCKFCIEEEPAEPAIRQALGVQDDEVFYRGRGCEQCNHTGHAGDHLIFELLDVTPEVHGLIRADAPPAAIFRQAVADGMTSAADSALTLARTRRISLAEAYRLFERTRIG